MLQKEFRDTITVAANDTERDILNDSDLGFAPSRGAFVTLASGSAAGIEASIRTPSQPSVMDDASIGAGNNNPPSAEQGERLHDPVPVRQGERIVIDLANTTAGSLDAHVVVKFKGR